MKHKKTIFGVLTGLALGLLAVALMPKGNIFRAEAATSTKTFAKEDITSLTSYSETDITADSVPYHLKNVMYGQYSGAHFLQFSKKTSSRDPGCVYNSTAYDGGITKIKLYASESSDRNTVGLKLYVGDTANPSTNETVASAAGEFTFDGTHRYASVVCSDDLTTYLDKIEITTGSADPVSSIEVTTPPTKTTYYAGETFDPTGMVVTATKESSSTEVVTDYTISPSGALSVSDTYVTISYQGKTCTQAITVNPIVITEIAVTTMPTVTSYYVGDDLDTTGIVVTGTHAGGSLDVTSACTFSPTSFVSGDIGTKPITVTHTPTGLTTTFDVTVAAAPAVATYVLVESTDNLSAGDKVIFAQRGTLTGVLGAFYKNSSGTTSYFTEAALATKSSDGKKILGLPEGAIEFTVEYNTSKSAYAFKSDANKYIAAKSSSSNITDYTTTLNDEGLWNLTISSSDTTMQSIGTYTRNYFAHNDSASRFSCYNPSSLSGIDNIGIYKYASGAESISLNKTTALGPTGTELVLTATPSTGYEVTSYTWVTGDDSVASISPTTGSSTTVTFEGEGTTTVTCNATDGTTDRSASCTITVHDYTYDVLTGNEYIITNSDFSVGLSTSDPTNEVTDVDFTLATNAFHFTRANVADNSYYITYGDKYLEKNGSQARLGFFDEPNTYWVVSRPTLGVDIFHLVDGNNYHLEYKGTNSGIKWIAVATPDSGCDDLGLSPVQEFSELQVSGAPTKTRYNVGESFDPTGVTVTAVFSAGVEKDVTAGMTWDTLQVGDTSATGRITLAGAERTAEVDGIEVTNYIVDSITVNHGGAIHSYFVGQPTSKEGLVVTATLVDEAGIGEEKQETVPAANYTISPSTVTAETTEITVSYGGKTDSYAITVKPVKYDLAESIKAGDHVVFTDGSQSLEMSDEDFSVTSYSYRPEGYDPYEVEKVSNGVWAFRNISNNKYLAADSKSLALVDTKTALASWTVSINRSTGYVYVANEGQSDRPYMAYNDEAEKIKMGTTSDIDIYKDITMVFPESIQVDSSSTHPTEFEIGDEFSYEGLKIKVNYGGGAFDVISTGFAVTAPDMNTAGTKPVTVSYLGVETSYNVTITPSVGPKTLVGIEARNYNTEFKVGDNFVFGGQVYALYSTAEEELLSASAYEITVHGPSGTGYPFTEANAHQLITVTLKSDYSKTFQYEVVVGEAAKLQSIAISGQKVEFNVGDQFEFGGTVTATFDDATTKNVTSEATFTGYNMNSVGTQTVTVSYSYKGVTKTTTYTITVKESGGGGGSDSSSESDNPSDDKEKKANNLVWIIPTAIGGTVLVAGLGVGIFFFIKAKTR